MPPTRKKKASTQNRVKLKPADSFDLIRLLAQTQSDARKAIGELVQNSLDAGARQVDITWFREKGAAAIRIVDDGEGIFPEMERQAALRRIATTIGHSHKRDLTPTQRRDLMLAGKYGIGLLGFWAVGHVMEIRSRVGGGETWCLRMEEDSPRADLLKVPRKRLHELDTYTEITVRNLHESAVRLIRPGRLQAYLATELRGQLLRRKVDVFIRDRVARGRAIKEFQVRAQRYQGRPIENLAALDVPGHDEARLDLYFVVEDDRAGRVSLACGGTTVLDDLATLSGDGEPRAPWSSGRFEGVIDFPNLDVVPGTRRGFRPSTASEAFIAALASVEGRLQELLQEEEKRRSEERDQRLAKEVRRAFRRMVRVLPQYDFFDVRGAGPGTRNQAPDGEALAEGEGAAGPSAPTTTDDAPSSDAEPPDDGALFPPGPLHRVKIVPARSRLGLGATRTLRARALDADGRAAAGEVRFSWSLNGPGALLPDGASVTYTAPDFPTTAELEVTAIQGARGAHATAMVKILEDLDANQRGIGIPDPIPVHAPTEPWRSRMHQDSWQYNTGHRDYIAASQVEARRLRYLIHLFAKEVVLRNFGAPGAADILERMVEVLTHLGDLRPGGSPAPRNTGAET